MTRLLPTVSIGHENIFKFSKVSSSSSNYVDELCHSVMSLDEAYKYWIIVFLKWCQKFILDPLLWLISSKTTKFGTVKNFNNIFEDLPNKGMSIIKILLLNMSQSNIELYSITHVV